ncbi:hypothetical protein HC891_18345, partial [Candidatus Gracilibacteria bacterium]|nr:hypothetical protein [Candidatus Gracilibacteria bacterium]
MRPTSESELPQRPARVEQLQFLGDDLVAVVLEGEGVAIPTRLVCVALGLDPEAQSERLRAHDVLAQGLRVVRVPLDGRVRPMLAIMHTHVAFWLATITPGLVAAAVRPKLVRYQQELVMVLNALYGPHVAPVAAGDAESLPIPSSAERQLAVVQQELLTLRAALLALVQSQRATEERVDTLDERVDGVADLVDELREIAKISAVQAEYLQRSLRRLAQRYQTASGTERNMFELLYAQFKMAMGIPRYDALPAKKYAQAVSWLREKAAELLPNDPDALPPMQEQLLGCQPPNWGRDYAPHAYSSCSRKPMWANASASHAARWHGGSMAPVRSRLRRSKTLRLSWEPPCMPLPRRRHRWPSPRRWC